MTVSEFLLYATMRAISEEQLIQLYYGDKEHTENKYD